MITAGYIDDKNSNNSPIENNTSEAYAFLKVLKKEIDRKDIDFNEIPLKI